MAIYNYVTFNLLCFQIALFVGLIVRNIVQAPLPLRMRSKMMRFIATSPVVAKLLYGLKIMFIFVAMLFFDAVQQMIKIHRQGDAARSGRLVGDIRSETDWRARKFLSERNMYLHGFTLFLGLILNRTYSLILDVIQAQEELATVKKQGAAPERSDKMLEQKLADLQKDYDELANRTGEASKASPEVKKAD